MARPQDKNLTPFTSEQNREEAAKNGRKGGVASGEARRRKKSMKESFEALFAMQACDKYKAAFKKQGISIPDDLTNEQALVLSMTAKAIAGDARMAALVLDVMGEKQSDVLKRKELELKEKQAMDTKNEALERLDQILRGLHEQAEDDE
jgi:hypothetical protein